MKQLLSSLMILFVCAAVFADQPRDYKPPVKVLMEDGRTIFFRLDHFDERRVIGIEATKDRDAVELAREQVLSIDFGRNESDQFQTGQEGFVLKDGTVVQGRPITMDLDHFWIRRHGHPESESIDRSSVVYIQFSGRSGDLDTYAGASTYKVLVDSKRVWTDSEILLKKGQRVWFTISPQSFIQCGPQHNSNAAGIVVSPEEFRRPLPDANACMLIARIGPADKFHRIGSGLQPLDVHEGGRLFLGFNDSNHGDNSGEIRVYIKVEEAGTGGN